VTLSISDLVPQHAETAFANVAFQIRAAIIAVNGKIIRRYITMIDAEPDLRCAFAPQPTATGPSSQLMVSSWAKILVESLDFGGRVGKPEVVRVHQATRIKCACILKWYSEEAG
jgi:hypothetical protein